MYSKRLGAVPLVPEDGKSRKPDPGILREKRGKTTITMYDSALSQSAYGRPRSMTPRLKTSQSPIRTITRTNGSPSVTLYDTALTMDAYGKPAMLGDFFGDVMGAVIGKQNWDARPDWMKKIQVKPDPVKLLNAASKVVPPSQVNRVLDQAQGAGMNLYYQTPMGNVPITSQTAGSLYSGMPILAQASSALGSVPVWVWAAGGGLLLALFVSMRK